MICRGIRTLRLSFATSYIGWNVGRECNSNIVWTIYNAVHNTGPEYFKELCILSTNERRSSLRSYKIGRVKGRHLNLGRGLAFSTVGPAAWTLLPVDIRQVPTLDTFKGKLKTFLSYHCILIYDAQQAPCEGFLDFIRHYIKCPYHRHHYHNHNNRSAALYESYRSRSYCIMQMVITCIDDILCLGGNDSFYKSKV